jgi:dipeptidyl aminopeptidase/acylaminoacyl peptidase
LSELCSDGTHLYWLESRPADGGRVVFVRGGPDAVDLSPPGLSVRSRVHEYGGGAACLVPGHGDGACAFVELTEQRVWCRSGVDAEPVALSSPPPEGEMWRHGGLSASADGNWVLAVREVHYVAGGAQEVRRPTRAIVALGTRPSNFGATVLFEGHDFYGAPLLNPAGDRVAVAAWDHPNMPWDESVIEVVTVTEGVGPLPDRTRLVADGAPWTVAGGRGESVGQPGWSSAGELRCVSDRSGWWLPYRHSGDDDGQAPAPMVDPSVQAEFHGADFVLGLTTMAELPDGRLVARQSSGGRDALVLISPAAASAPGRPTVEPLPQPCVAISALCTHADGVAIIGATPDSPADVWLVPVPGAGRRSTSKGSARDRVATGAGAAGAALAPEQVAVGESFTLAGDTGRMVHGVFFAPVNSEFCGSPHAPPPLLVHCHGGPTSSASAAFDLTIQYFTSRGFAVASVDYAGSTGHGRAYREALWGEWGVADAEDCVQAARWLAGRGQVDAARMAIRGGSAGGWTALNALRADDGFSAAVSWYGVTDLLALAASTHDFEAHYMDRLVGPLPASRDRYESLSPVNSAASLRGAVLLLQGRDDPVVPPAQTERLRDELLAAGRHCETRLFDHEGHGFRRAETLIACLEAELDFYQRVLRL